MNVTEKNGKLFVYEKDNEIFKISQWQRGKNKATGKVEKFSGNKDSLIESLKNLKEKLVKEFSLKKLELNLGKQYLADQTFDDIVICNRGMMQLNLRKYELDNKVSESLGDYKPFELVDLKTHVNEIYEATPDFDRNYMGAKNPIELYEIYERAVLEKEFGSMNPELSFELVNPFRGFILSIDFINKNNNFLIGDLLVLPKHRNKGLGTALIKEVLNRGKAKGYSKALLAVTLKNPAFTIYKKIGFSFIARTTLMLVNN
jgi:ribosomal protein S18 acetylase RimI-like enzyme